MLTGNLDDMIKYGTPGGGTDIAKLPADQRKKVLDSIKNITPKRYKITARQLSSDGNRLTMRGTGTGATILGEAALPQDGEILMVKQSGEWKVDEVNWKGRKPGAAPATSTMSPAPEKKLGAAKEPCVYKSVMTDEDMARCR